MVSTSNIALLAYAIAGGGAVLMGVLVWWGFKVMQNHARDAAYDDQLQDLLNGESDEDEVLRLERGRNFSEKWRLYWQKVGTGTGFARYADKNNSAPRDIVVFWIGVVAITSVLLQNPIIGILIGSGAVYSFSFIAKFRYNRQVAVIQDQLPGFLFALKANIQANETPVRAMLKVVDNMPSPLRDDLMIVKQKILANAPFAEALQALVERTASNELRFLATCLIQASGTGANIEPQLNTIQRVLEQRKKAADELAKAVKGTIPAIAISSVAIPGSFLATYIMDPTAKQFWFKELLSWAALFMIGALYAFGMWLTHRMVENIKNL